MKTADFDYHLPEKLIAQTPLKDRSASRLLVVDREKHTYVDRHFTNILDYLQPGDALVLNETKVLPARIYGVKAETGGAVELLLLKELGQDEWQCLARPQKRLKAGTKIHFHEQSSNSPSSSTPLLTATVTAVYPNGITNVKFNYKGIFLEILNRLGSMPLPPYIHEQLKDQTRYQTVYAKNLGSAAAPTAGLHFTSELLQQAEQKGIKIVKITLHVGLGTFRPVQVADVTKHQMHKENYQISQTAANTLNAVRKSGHKIVAVGTTSVRTLETNLQHSTKRSDLQHSTKSSLTQQSTKKAQPPRNTPQFFAETSDTSIFIYPGFQFQAIDALITNFHLPKSTLIMLVSAFADKDLILKAYKHAVESKYRFFSFGDAMLII